MYKSFRFQVLTLVKKRLVSYYPSMKRHSRLAYLYLLPALLISVLFAYWPFIKTVVNSFYLVTPLGKIVEYVGLDHFKRLFEDRNFQASFINTFRFTFLFVPLTTLWALICALLVVKKRRFSALGELAFMLPLVVAMSSAALIFKALFNPTIGVVNYLFSLSIQWFNDPVWALWVVIFLCIWMAMGLDFLLFLSALRSIGPAILEAAELAGASKWQQFWRIQLPLISPTLMFIVANRLRDGILLSGPIMVMTEGGPFRSTQTLVYQMYVEGFKSGNYSLASAISVVVFLLSFLLVAFSFRFEKRGVFYQ